MNRNLFLVLLGITVSLLDSALQAATPDSGGKLKIGDPAPALQQGKYIQGEPVAKLDAGKAYVVEFWATWCGPCRTSIPHLNDIHDKFKDQGLIVIGQDVWERGETVETAVTDFVKGMGSKMTYRVALDSGTGMTGAMAKSWMGAAGQNGIPTAFVVDQSGKIAWIGHPMSGLEEAVGQVLAGKFDLEKSRQEFERRLASRAEAAAARTAAKPKVARDVDDKLESLIGKMTSKPATPTLPAEGLLAHYPLHEDFANKTGAAAPLQNKNAPLAGRALYLNGNYEHGGGAGYRAYASVPELDYSRLTVAFDFWPIDLKPGDVIFMGGNSYRWLGMSVDASGALFVTANNGRARFSTGAKATAQAWHSLACSFDLTQKTVLVSFDGKLLPKIGLPEDFKLDIIGSPAEPRDKVVGFTDYSHGGVFHGFVSELRIYGRALAASEMPGH